MLFEWNGHKRRVNRRKHGLDFADCERVMLGPTATALDRRFDYGEDRLLTYGLLNGVVVAITHLLCGDTVRVISFRRATKYEQTSFYKGFETGSKAPGDQAG